MPDLLVVAALLTSAMLGGALLVGWRGRRRGKRPSGEKKDHVRIDLFD